MGTLITARDQAEKAHDAAQRQHSTIEHQLETARSKHGSALRNGYTTAGAHLLEVRRLESLADEAQRAENHARDALIAAGRAILEARAARHEARIAAARDMLGQPADLIISVDWGARDGFSGARWELKLAQLDEAGAWAMERGVYEKGPRTGEAWEYPKYRFGFEATVYGARRHYRGDAWEDDAQVNWGSMGALSIAAARDMMRVHGYAIEIAAWLDTQRDAWLEEDLAD